MKKTLLILMLTVSTAINAQQNELRLNGTLVTSGMYLTLPPPYVHMEVTTNSPSDKVTQTYAHYTSPYIGQVSWILNRKTFVPLKVKWYILKPNGTYKLTQQIILYVKSY